VSLCEDFLGGQGQNRTADTKIFSLLLYRLSYLPTVWDFYCYPSWVIVASGANHRMMMQPAAIMIFMQWAWPLVYVFVIYEHSANAPRSGDRPCFVARLH
jgi:hypothetical protein